MKCFDKKHLWQPHETLTTQHHLFPASPSNLQAPNPYQSCIAIGYKACVSAMLSYLQAALSLAERLIPEPYYIGMSMTGPQLVETLVLIRQALYTDPATGPVFYVLLWLRKQSLSQWETKLRMYM